MQTTTKVLTRFVKVKADALAALLSTPAMANDIDNDRRRFQVRRTPMKAHQLLNSREVWCQESPAEDGQGNKLQALDPRAEKWCALAAIQKVYPPWQWEKAMDQLLRALSVSEKGLAQMTISDKACSLMEWNDDRQSTFREIQETLLAADV
jgi:hypothetical protein